MVEGEGEQLRGGERRGKVVEGRGELLKEGG